MEVDIQQHENYVRIILLGVESNKYGSSANYFDRSIETGKPM
jgi:hypothetical protein